MTVLTRSQSRAQSRTTQRNKEECLKGYMHRKQQHQYRKSRTLSRMWQRRRHCYGDDDEDDDECGSGGGGGERRSRERLGKTSLLDILAGGGEEKMDEHIKIIGEDTIYFCDDVTTESISRLCEYITLMANYLQKIAVDLPGYQPRIKLYLYTFGGDAYAGIGAYQFIRTCAIPVDIYVHGFVASAGTIMLMAGATRYMDATSVLLIHQVRSGLWGKLDEMEDEMKNIHRVMNIMKKIYRRHTNMTAEQLNQMLTNELDMSASECLKYGVVDVIIKKSPYSTKKDQIK